MFVGGKHHFDLYPFPDLPAVIWVIFFVAAFAGTAYAVRDYKKISKKMSPVVVAAFYSLPATLFLIWMYFALTQ